MKTLLKNVLVNNSATSILVDGGMISEVSPDIAADNDTDVFNGGGRIAALPPFYNMHNHAAMTLLRGYAEDMELFDWLNNHIWPIEAKLNAEDIYTGTRLATVEMIRSGCVYFNDSYWHPEAALRAVKESGMRAALGLLYLGDISAENRKANEALTDAAKDEKMITVTHTPHAIYTVNKETLKDISKMMENDGRCVHIHVSETAREVSDCRKEHDGMTPVEYLDSLGLISERSVLAHCVHLTEHDREIIATRGAFIAHNPVSNLKLCSGMFDFEAAIAAGCKVTIGTDGCSSNNNLSMIDEMKSAALTAKAVTMDPLSGKTADIFHAATAAGAEFAGVKIGKIAPGYAADLMLIDMDHPTMSGGYDLIADMVYAASADVVDSVMCNGKFLMRNKIIPQEKEIISAAREVCRKIASWK